MEINNLLTNLEVKEISIVNYGANNKKFLCVKNLEGKDIKTENIFWLKKESDNMVITEEQNKMAKDAIEKTAKEAAEKVLNENTEKVAKAAEDKAKADKITKDATEAKEKLEKEQKEAMVKAVAEKEALVKELLSMKEEVKKARDEAKIEKDARLLSISKEFAKENLGMLGDHGELGVFLKEAKEVLIGKSYEFLVTTLKSANEKIAKGGLFQEIGKDASQTASGNILEKINKMASDIMNAEKIGYDEAVAKVFEKDTKLYEEYEKQNKGSDN